MEETLQQVDEVVHIPMLGSKESLNVGQAAAIFMWELD
jgi:tRNA G18 (ribose-2'-O)-methylase SpoU